MFGRQLQTFIKMQLQQLHLLQVILQQRFMQNQQLLVLQRILQLQAIQLQAVFQLQRLV